MITITTTSGKTEQITAMELQRAVVAYLREHSPGRVVVIAEEINENGNPETKAAAIMMLAKNPEAVNYYTDVVTPKNYEKQ